MTPQVENTRKLTKGIRRAMMTGTQSREMHLVTNVNRDNRRTNPWIRQDIGEFATEIASVSEVERYK
jgi:hypothetical protein